MKYYVRYADDFIFLSRDKFQLGEAIPKIQEFLQSNLKLTLHPDKVFIKTVASGVDFLGMVNFDRCRVLRPATRRRMLKNVEKGDKNETLQSYLGLLKHCDGYKLAGLIKKRFQNGSRLDGMGLDRRKSF